MPASRSATVVISNTTQVVNALNSADDFLTVAQLVAITKLKPKSVMTALHWLRKIKAVDSLESGGLLYFFSTPDADMRVRTYDEHRKEDEPRHLRAVRKKPVAK